jgi:hypothetical protein
VLKALTIKQPWAGAIAYGTKDVENRSWPMPREDAGQVIAIHAGKSVDAGAQPPGGGGWPAGDWPLGAILAVATLKGSHRASRCSIMTGLCSPWAQQGQWHWEVTDVRPLARTVPCRGYQKLWAVPDDAEAAVRAQLEAVRG